MTTHTRTQNDSHAESDGNDQMDPQPGTDVQSALIALIAIVDAIGGYMTPEQQQALFAARQLSKRAP